jgi:hypothetical protein
VHERCDAVEDALETELEGMLGIVDTLVVHGRGGADTHSHGVTFPIE